MMTEQEQRQLVAEFIGRQTFAVVSSIWQGRPQSAVVVFSIKNDFELIFGTNNFTRKYRNLKTGPSISAVLGWDEGQTVQYEGTATEVSAADMDEYRQIHLKKNPGSALYTYLDTQRYFSVTPDWIRYTDIRPEPEFSFDLVIPGCLF